MGLAGALVFAFSIVYVATERDKKVDLSYFRTAKAGEATRKLVASIDQPVEVDLFFPSANEVKDQVASYFDELRKESKLLEVHQYDHAIDPAKAKELGVSGNGVVAIKRDKHKELLSVGLELEAARTQLSNLDKEVNKRLTQVAKPQRTVFLTIGHGERADTPANDTDKRGTIHDLRELLLSQGYQVRNLGAADGFAADVPSDAAMVLTIGPQKPFLAEELAAMERYLDKGGRWFLALDPENGAMKELTSLLALSYTPVTLANDMIYARRTYQNGDRINIATGSYSSHPSVTTLSHLGMRAPMILVGAGPLEEIVAKDRPAPRKDLAIDFTVRSHMATWNDLDGNFQLDAPREQRRIWNLGAAVVRKRPGNKASDETRALVLGDSGRAHRRDRRQSGQRLLPARRREVAARRRGHQRRDVERGGRADRAHAQPGRHLVLRNDRARARAGAGRGAANHAPPSQGETVMKIRGAAIQGGLAALGLLAAYATWQREPERAAGEATLIEAAKSDLGKIRFEEGAKWVELEQKADASGPVVWLHVSARADAKPSPAPERVLRGNAGADKLLDKLAPLGPRARSACSTPAKLKELGLDAPKKKLTITARGTTHVFDVGVSPYGVSDPYVKDQKDGRVYVLGGGIISDLDSASVRLVERTLHTFKPTEWDGSDRERRRQEARAFGADRRQARRQQARRQEVAEARRRRQELARQAVSPGGNRGAGPGRKAGGR